MITLFTNNKPSMKTLFSLKIFISFLCLSTFPFQASTDYKNQILQSIKNHKGKLGLFLAGATAIYLFTRKSGPGSPPSKQQPFKKNESKIVPSKENSADSLVNSLNGAKENIKTQETEPSLNPKNNVEIIDDTNIFPAPVQNNEILAINQVQVSVPQLIDKQIHEPYTKYTWPKDGDAYIKDIIKNNYKEFSELIKKKNSNSSENLLKLINKNFNETKNQDIGSKKFSRH